jgi:hypothetical protein
MRLFPSNNSICSRLEDNQVFSVQDIISLGFKLKTNDYDILIKRIEVLNSYKLNSTIEFNYIFLNRNISKKFRTALVKAEII